MENYKICVNNEAESKEAQELFVQLGYSNRQSKRFGFVYTQNGEIGCDSMEHWDYYNDLCQELTLPQLRDLVVLKRNDVKDATHKNFRTNTLYLKQGENEYYMFNGEWVLSNCPNDLEPINKPQDPDLISGSDAMIAALDGKHVVWQWADGCGNWQEFNDEEWTVDDLKSDRYNFKIIPQTIKLELELPKPFEPKEGEEYFGLNNDDFFGYSKYIKGRFSVSLLAFRTENDAKKAVEQLRKIKGAV